MKRVDDMSVLEMQRYFERIDKVKSTVGKTYRLIWPLDGWDPYFSPVRLIFNLHVLASWLFVAYFLLTRPYSEETALLTLGRAWAYMLAFLFVLSIFERHYRIKSRYRQATRKRESPIPPPPPKDADPFFYYGKELFRRVFR